MSHIRPCKRCGAGVSGPKRYCAPCADIRRAEAKERQNAQRPKAQPVEGVRYIGTRVGMMKVRS